MSVRDYLERQGVRFEVLLHRPAASAARLARCVHAPGGRVAKAVLVRAAGEYVLAVLPATHRIDLARLGRALGIEDLGLAGEADLERIFPDCQPGALPPLGRAYGLRAVLDSSLIVEGDVLFEGNTRHEGVRMRFADYEAIERPLRADFAVAIAPRRRRERPLRAS